MNHPKPCPLCKSPLYEEETVDYQIWEVCDECGFTRLLGGKGEESK